MGHKRAKQRRRLGTDRRALKEIRDIEGLSRPKSPQTEFELDELRKLAEWLPALDENLLGNDGLLRVLPSEGYSAFPRRALQVWAHELGYHLFPTEELVGWLRQEIGGLPAIEICAGAGVLGRALEVPCVDWNVCKRFPAAKAFYQMNGQPMPMIGSHCEDIEALEAVAKYRPHVVFGAYITQRVYASEPTTTPGSAYGVDERTLIRVVRKYIAIGQRRLMQDKRIWRQRTQELTPSWLVTRTADPADQLIAVWDNPNPSSLEEVLRLPEPDGKPPETQTQRILSGASSGLPSGVSGLVRRQL